MLSFIKQISVIREVFLGHPFKAIDPTCSRKARKGFWFGRSYFSHIHTSINRRLKDVYSRPRLQSGWCREGEGKGHGVRSSRVSSHWGYKVTGSGMSGWQ